MKKLFALLLVLTLCIGLAACGKGAAEAEAPTETTAEPTEASAEAPTETKPIQSIVGDAPISTGSGCQPSPEDYAE